MAISFETPRLNVQEITIEIETADQHVLLEQIPTILTPAVVESLPPYFQNVTSKKEALVWLDQMRSESRLLLIKTKQNDLIGFLFAYVESDQEVHIGYLFSENNWGKGFASEVLRGFIKTVTQTEPWQKLIGGVDPSNITSIKLLKKLGFVERLNESSETLFFDYKITNIR
jgi:RimJ/RimL family protein N-acetyltransferase